MQVLGYDTLVRPWSGRSPEKESVPGFLPRESHGQGNWWARSIGSRVRHDWRNLACYQPPCWGTIVLTDFLDYFPEISFDCCCIFQCFPSSTLQTLIWSLLSCLEHTSTWLWPTSNRALWNIRMFRAGRHVSDVNKSEDANWIWTMQMKRHHHLVLLVSVLHFL